ncbi:hypothetical protein AB0M87_07880 [Streptomyces sp. NPDC051320]|uniref:hypothetical protein n=1 Tax=Streptomyces sp. NPDC051320 TaxID=3154644 RepID=UPI003438B9D4
MSGYRDHHRPAAELQHIAVFHLQAHPARRGRRQWRKSRPDRYVEFLQRRCAPATSPRIAGASSR